jgi:hypothetical protein
VTLDARGVGRLEGVTNVLCMLAIMTADIVNPSGQSDLSGSPEKRRDCAPTALVRTPSSTLIKNSPERRALGGTYIRVTIFLPRAGSKKFSTRSIKVTSIQVPRFSILACRPSPSSLLLFPPTPLLSLFLLPKRPSSPRPPKSSPSISSSTDQQAPAPAATTKKRAPKRTGVPATKRKLAPGKCAHCDVDEVSSPLLHH